MNGEPVDVIAGPVTDEFEPMPVTDYPDTAFPYEDMGEVFGRVAGPLLPPPQYTNRNTHIPNKGVAPVGPQSDATRVQQNLGSIVVPANRQYLELAGQRQVGVLPRVLPTNETASWDEMYALNPSVEVI